MQKRVWCMVISKATMIKSSLPCLAAAWIWLIVIGQSSVHVAGDPYWTSENMSPQEVLEVFVTSRNGTVGSHRKWNRTATSEQRRLARMKQLESDPDRKERIHRVLRNAKPQTEKLLPMTPEELVRIEEQNPNLRSRKISQSYSPYSLGNLADPGADYNMWSQAYRMLGGFIDCGHNKFSGDQHKGNRHNYNFENKDGACTRWMMWAAYVDPNYQGKGYNEYRGDNPVGTLDCHEPNTKWKLIGVYRQEFYQFIEQISKHLWVIDDYDYVTALAGLAYMTDNDCFSVNDKDSSGNEIYAGVAPQAMGKFQIALYTDEYCLTPNNNLGKNYDSYGHTTSLDLNDSGGNNNKNNKNGNNNNNNNYQKKNYNQNSDVYTWWSAAQEYTLTNVNNVYEAYKYCTPCIDYPTYQDGYLIGNSGTDDESLINQCWKFYSHNSYPCTADCISLGHAQGTILSVDYNGVVFGKHLDESYSVQELENGAVSNAYRGESKWKRLMANLFAAISFVVFVTTFLAFAVARRSRYRESRSSKGRRLLDEEEKTTSRSRKLTRSPSKEKGDGLFRSPSGGRSKSADKSRRKSRSKSADKRSKSKSRNSSNYNPPEAVSPGEKSGRKSRRVVDDF